MKKFAWNEKWPSQFVAHLSCHDKFNGLFYYNKFHIIGGEVPNNAHRMLLLNSYIGCN